MMTSRRSRQGWVVALLAITVMGLVGAVDTVRASDERAHKPGEPKPVELPEVDATTSYASCYFRTSSGSTTWQWALTVTDAYYTFPGDWITTPHTGIEKFKTTTSYEDLYDACQYSKIYYGVNGTLYSIFAATSSIGYNYPIVVGGAELFPLY